MSAVSTSDMPSVESYNSTNILNSFKWTYCIQCVHALLTANHTAGSNKDEQACSSNLMGGGESNITEFSNVLAERWFNIKRWGKNVQSEIKYYCSHTQTMTIENDAVNNLYKSVVFSVILKIWYSGSTKPQTHKIAAFRNQRSQITLQCAVSGNKDTKISFIQRRTRI